MLHQNLVYMYCKYCKIPVLAISKSRFLNLKSILRLFNKNHITEYEIFSLRILQRMTKLRDKLRNHKPRGRARRNVLYNHVTAHYYINRSKNKNLAINSFRGLHALLVARPSLLPAAMKASSDWELLTPFRLGLILPTSHTTLGIVCGTPQ